VEATADIGSRYLDEKGADGQRQTSTATPRGVGLTATQTLFNGYQTANRVRMAESQVSAGREALRLMEQTVLLDYPPGSTAGPRLFEGSRVASRPTIRPRGLGGQTFRCRFYIERSCRTIRADFALAWMVIEAEVAIGSGLAAASPLLMAFGIDSLIELASALVLIWRLDVELRRGEIFAERAERLAARTGGVLLFALAFYVVASAGWKLWMQEGAEFSLPGFIVSVVAIPVMYVLSRRKLRLARALGSRAPRANAVEGITCGWLAFVV
jgi:hypothetical protein